MYNIDFRISGQIVSISVCLNDSISKLITKMKELQPFQKYTSFQLQDKLVKSLNQIITKQSTQTKIKYRIQDLLNNIPCSDSTQKKNVQLTNQGNYNKNNNTFLNLLQQASLNSSYLCQNSRSQTKLNRKYDDKSLDRYENGQNLIEDQLKYKYEEGNIQKSYNKINETRNKQTNNARLNNQRRQNLYNVEKSQTKTHTDSYLDKKKNSLNYIQAQPVFQRSIIKDQSNNRRVNVQKYLDEVRQIPNKTLTKQKVFIKNTIDHDNITKNTTINNRISLNETQRLPYQNQPSYARNYNPVPKLNQLIERTKSLSQITTKNYNHQSHLIQKNLNQNYHENKTNPGKIHHRQTNTNSSILRQNLTKINQNEIPVRSSISYNRQIQTKVQYQPLKQRQFSQILSQKNKNQTIYQKQGNYRQNKRVYSYL